MKNRFTLKNRFLQKKDDEAENGDFYGPSEKALRNVINYSRSLSVIKTKFIGNVHVILN